MHLASGIPAAPEWLQLGTIWSLTAPLNLYSQSKGMGLATQAWAGRHLQILAANPTAPAGDRLRVRLLEDGYPGWIGSRALLGRALASRRPRWQGLHRSAIELRLDQVLAFAASAHQQPNRYLWGGSLGPDYDCSGLVQRAYASAGIWIPRDAYLQERFCQPVAVKPGQIQLLLPGDLIFFGSPQRCSHVGLHLGGGSYLHSSGLAHGHNGIGIDSIACPNPDPVGRHYLAELRGAGRVMHSDGGSPGAA
ncbi:MAG: NlpC/P60 family protein [Synechococcus sp.]|nr:NlpC/P60 family protein [Synechococcus sp.]